MEKVDINVFSIRTICIWMVAFFVMEFAMRYVYLNLVGGENLEKWYGFRDFNPYNVVIGDMFYTVIGLIIAYRIHSHFFSDVKDPVIKFILLFVIFWIVQMTGDLLFYQIVKRINTENHWINFFQNYGKTAKLNAVFGDSIYILVWAITVYLIKDLPNDVLLAISLLFIFIISIFSESKKRAT